MGTVQDISSLGYTPIDAQHLGFDYASGLTATGNNSQANAYQIANNYVQFTTVTGTNNSAKLPAIVSSAYSEYIVRNESDNNLYLFPATGEAFNALAANAAVTLYPNTAVHCVKVSESLWIIGASDLITEVATYKSKAAVYHNTDGAISKTATTFGYLNFSSGDCKVSLSVAAGEYVEIHAGVFHSTSAAGTFPQFSLYQNTNPIGSVSNARNGTFSTTGEDYQYNTSLILTAPAIGTVEYSLQWKRQAGAGTVYARFPYLMVKTFRGV